MKIADFILLNSICLALYGCSSYYLVKDPHSGAVYYTTEIEDFRDGAVKFTDARNRVSVTVQSPEVRKMVKSEYEAAISAPPASKVRPVGVRNRDEAR